MQRMEPSIFFFFFLRPWKASLSPLLLLSFTSDLRP